MEIIMSDQPEINESHEEKDVNSETLIVPPPGFRERLQAAQRARANEIRASVELPSNLTRSRFVLEDEEVSLPTLNTADVVDETHPSTR
jgi:hypothetical protein